MPGRLTFVEMVKKFTAMPGVLAKRCRRLLANETLMAEWRAHDALLTAPFPPPGDDTCACLVAHTLGLPLLHVRDMTLNAAPHDVPQVSAAPPRTTPAVQTPSPRSPLLETSRSAAARMPAPPPSLPCAASQRPFLPRPLLHPHSPLVCLHSTRTHNKQMGSGLTRDEVRGSWRGYLRNLAFYAVQRAFNLVLGRYERAAFAPLRRELGLPLSHYTRSDGSGLTCEPWVEAVSANWLFEEPQPLAPPQVMVGAISPHPARPAIADADVAGFAAAAEASGHGLALVSFGSISAVFGSVLNTEDYEQLALGFADLAPVRVLWLLKPDAVPGGAAGLAALPLGNNTLVKPWGHINDILGHRATRVFVSHGGQKSVLEAMFHGVPVVGVPFMVEQAMNSGRAAARGFGVVSPEAAALRAPGQRFTRASVAGLVRTVLEPRYAQAAHAVGEAMRAAYAMRAPADRAAEEIELALLHGGYRVEAAVRAAAARRARRQQQQQQQQEEEAGGAAPAPVTEASQQRGRAAAAAAAAAEADVGGAKAAGVAAAGHSEL